MGYLPMLQAALGDRLTIGLHSLRGMPARILMRYIPRSGFRLQIYRKQIPRARKRVGCWIAVTPQG